jgi:DNA-binding transcriptional regulator LsrR (DeoR family)
VDTVFSPITNKAYFKKHGKLYEAPFNEETMDIDFTEVCMVDYFFLTSEEFENAMAVLSILEERNEIQ